MVIINFNKIRSVFIYTPYFYIYILISYNNKKIHFGIINLLFKRGVDFYMFNFTGCNEFMKVTFLDEVVSYDDFEKAVNYLLSIQRNNHNYESKIKVIYKEPSHILSRRKERLVDKTDVKFFINDGRVCYTTTGRTGYLISSMSYPNVRELILANREVSMEEREIKNRKRQSSQFKRILREKYDNITWSNLTETSFEPGSRFYNITKCNFPSFVYTDLENAFKNKTSYHYKTYGTRRDFSVETKMSEDGIFRAWFSSEYAGCGNGQYYLLINPTTAVFYEND